MKFPSTKILELCMELDTLSLCLKNFTGTVTPSGMVGFEMFTARLDSVAKRFNAIHEQLSNALKRQG